MARSFLIEKFLPAPWALILLLLIGLIASWFTVTRLQLDNSPEAYLPTSAPAVQFDQQLRLQFPDDEVLVLMFQGEVYSQTFQQQLSELVAHLERHDGVQRVFSFSTVDHISGSEDGFSVEPLLLPSNVESAQAAKQHVLSDRFAPGTLASPDGSLVALAIRPVTLKDSLQRQELFDLAMDGIHAVGAQSQFAGAAGPIALDVAQFAAMKRDAMSSIPLTALVGILLIWWIFRRPMAVALAAVTLFVLVTMSVAIVAIWGRPFTLVQVMLPALLSALATALLIHFFNGLLHASQRGYQGVARVRQAWQETYRPAWFCALTTSAGLFSLGFNQIQPIQTFGIAGGIAVLLMVPVIFGLVAPMFAQWDRHPWPVRQGSLRLVDAIVRVLARIAIRRPLMIVIVLLVVFAAGMTQIMKVTAETDLYRFFHDDHVITQSTKLAGDQLSGVTTLELVLDAPERDGLISPERLKAIKSLQAWLETQPEVDRTTSMADFVEEMNWGFHGEAPEYRVVPENRRLIGQYLLMYDGRDLYEIVDRDFQRTRLTMSLNVTAANDIQRVMTSIESHLKSQPVADLTWTLAGYGRLFSDQEDLLVPGQVNSLWSALVLISLLMLLMWRSINATLLTMIPNVAPILLVFMVMGALGVWLDMATALIACVAAGIAVDDTIHLYHGYSRRVRQGLRPVLALARTYRQAGRAVVATTLVLCGQLLLLTTSPFVPTSEFGALTALGLFGALIFDLMLLPALLMLRDGRVVRA